MTEPTRAYIYRIALAVGVLLVAIGVVTDTELPVILDVIAAVLAVGPAALATRHTSRTAPPANAQRDVFDQLGEN